ncbi:unnamed protein product [Sphagnum balticum]
MQRSFPERTDEATRPGSNGSHNNKDVHRPPQSHDHPFAPTEGTMEAAKAPNLAHFIQIFPLTSPPHAHQISQLQVLDRDLVSGAWTQSQ